MSVTNWKYLKVYTGYTTGSMGGREDGYPEQRTLFFENERALYKDPKRESQEIFDIQVTRIDPEKLIALIIEQKQLIEQEIIAQDRAADMKELERLKKKLGV